MKTKVERRGVGTFQTRINDELVARAIRLRRERLLEQTTFEVRRAAA